MQEITGKGLMQTVKDRKKTIIMVVVIAIIVLSVIGNGWALWKHYITKVKDAARAGGWATFAGQIILQSEGCKPVDITSGPLTERFIRVSCLAAPGATAPAPPAPRR